MAYAKVKRRSTGYSADRTSYEQKLYTLAGRYASHMGFKYSLSDSEVRRNHSRHYAKAKQDPEFRKWLFDQYSGD